MATEVFAGARVFDGLTIRPGAVVIADGRVSAIVRAPDATGEVTDLGGGILAPGFVDLQVNGGGGVMLNDAPTVATLRRIADAHAGLGTTALFPTLITDTPETTRAAVDAVAEAVAAGVPGIAGLHLEGPHLSLARKGAHDPALIRQMAEGDLAFLLDAARRLPRLLVTLAPESVTAPQVAALAGAGVIVSLGHTDSGLGAVRAAVDAGARLATHLFNAMSQLASREPGLVGAVLTDGRLDAGLIADGIHVHPMTMRAALAAKAGPGEVFLVTDAMAPAGTSVTEFLLNGRTIRRSERRLTLTDGTLAGADLDMARALRVLTHEVGMPLVQALAMATRIPARVAGLSETHGALMPGRVADLVHLSDDLRLRAVWRGGVRIALLQGAE